MLPVLLSIPKGLEDVAECNKIKCKIANPAITKGNKKCKLKNLFNVGLSTEKPPHNQLTIDSPTKGIAENKFVINSCCPETHLSPR